MAHGAKGGTGGGGGPGVGVSWLAGGERHASVLAALALRGARLDGFAGHGPTWPFRWWRGQSPPWRL
jgi:hypothetical protein